MQKLWFGLSLLLPLAASAHEMAASKTVISASDVIQPVIGLPSDETGDVYVAAQIVGDTNFTLYFLDESGHFQLQAVPFRRNAGPESNFILFSLPGAQLPSGRYILYSVVTEPDADVFDTRSWHGGWAGLRRLLFTVHQPQPRSLDFDSDGWPDDDRNRDGFHDDDENFDSYHDDDRDHDGYHDDDRDFDGCHDSGMSRQYEHSGDDHEEHSEDDHEEHSEDDHEEHSEDDLNCTLPPPSNLDGASLYMSYCASCHGNTPDSRALKGSNAQVIANAIASNKGGMGWLQNVLNNEHLQAIASFLSSRR